MTLRSLPLLAAVLAASMACREDTTAQSHVSPQDGHDIAQNVITTDPLPSAIVPHIPLDRSIRRELNFAIARDPELKERNLSFIVGNGDISVTGVVRNESERERINALALSIPGVKSIANAVRSHREEAMCMEPNNREESKDLSEVDNRKAGNKPAFDRDR
jgi:osmotically-inducible protein OsmY